MTTVVTAPAASAGRGGGSAGSTCAERVWAPAALTDAGWLTRHSAAVLPADPGTVDLAPRASSVRSAPACPVAAAATQGVVPPFAGKSKLAPSSARATNALSEPTAAAKNAAVRPYSSLASTGAPAATAARKSSTLPLAAASASRCARCAFVAPASNLATNSLHGWRASTRIRSSAAWRIASAADASTPAAPRQSAKQGATATASKHTASAGAGSVGMGKLSKHRST
mmetsp:Transcript_36466/g.100424  ORF Transcript_36466/g.100424 Transcript_36466/m.100424 type:complete len:227 (+) Transcript_36466:461-1141(+)